MMRISTSTAWVIRPRPIPNATRRLFCFPYAGGGATVFHAWARLLPPHVELCNVQLPGRGSRLGEVPFTSLPPLIEAVASALTPFFDRPFIFLGHSMGGLISFELTRYLRRFQHPMPERLVISGRGAPHLADLKKPLHALPETEFLHELRQLNGTPREVLDNRELMELCLPILRADFAVCETYQYRPEVPLDCPLTVLGGVEDRDIDRERLTGWRDHTTQEFQLRMFPGDHFFLHSAQAEYLQLVSALLT